MMKKIAYIFAGLITLNSLTAQEVDLNVSYDYFRGLPDGSWNGNSGLVVSANMGRCVYDNLGVQVGGSYGFYNWDGRQNLVFQNPKSTQQIGFVTAGLSYSYGQFNVGIVNDFMYTRHFGIYNLNPSLDQLRFQAGYEVCSNEFGFWGTVGLSEAHKKALGVPTKFKSINQINLFWTHEFDNCSRVTLFAGAPYSNSLIYRHKTAGLFTSGFSLKAPLTDHLYLEGNGSYMGARHSSGISTTRNYAAGISIGITYLFSKEFACETYCKYDPYMSLGNHSNFLVDTNFNQ